MFINKKKYLINIVNNKRNHLYIFFILGLVSTLFILFAGKQIFISYRKKTMLDGSIASYRAIDGAKNCVVMIGDSGYVCNNVYVKYLKDGYISVVGTNYTNEFQWKKIASIELEPGNYTFTGLNDNSDSIDLQLNYNDGDDLNWLFLSDEDISFSLREKKGVEIYIRVYPNSTVDILARPAVYKNE